MKLWKHQEDGISKAREMRNLAVFFEAGTGKTLTTLHILKEKEELYGFQMSTLIVCPVIVMRQWKSEIEKYFPDNEQNVVVLEGTARERMGLYEKAPKDSIFIINFEGISRIKPILEKIMYNPPQVLVVDESHKAKAPTSLVSKTLQKLSKQMEGQPIHHKYILTGSPILNNEIDIWSQYMILNQGKTFGSNFFAFRNKYFYDKNKYIQHLHFPKWCFIPSKEAEFKKKLEETSVQAKKEECLDLPDLVRVRVDVPMTKEQAETYKDMKEDFIAFIKGKTATAPLALTKALGLQQIVSGFVKTDDGTVVEFKDTPRQTALEALLEDLAPQGKVIIWAVFHKNYDVIRSVCNKLKLKYVELSGEAKEDRFESVKAFQEDESVRVLIGHPGSGGVGVNLTAAKYSIWWSRSFSLEHEIQATARNYRGGSEVHNKITRYDLVTPKTLDETVMQALENKKDLAERLLDLKNMVDG